MAANAVITGINAATDSVSYRIHAAAGVATGGAAIGRAGPGTLAPGTSPGAITFNGGYDQAVVTANVSTESVNFTMQNPSLNPTRAMRSTPFPCACLFLPPERRPINRVHGPQRNRMWLR